MAEQQAVQEETFNLEENTAKALDLNARASALERETGQVYAELGKVLKEVKAHLRHGEWLNWLERVRISRSKASKCIIIAEDPWAWERSGRNLANVTKGNVSALIHSNDGKKAVEEVIYLIEKLDEEIGWLSDEDKQNSDLKYSLDCLHARLHRIGGLCPECTDVPKWENGVCPICDTTEAEIIAQEQAQEQQKMEEDQERIEIEGQWEQLVSHPAYPWMKVLVVKNGESGGEIRDNIWSKKNYSKTHDEIAQELGYERDAVPAIGHSPSYDMMADERFRHDLREAYWLNSQLQAGAKELGIKLQPVDIKGRLPPRNKLLPRIKLVRFKPTCLKCKWHKHCILEPKGGCSYFTRKRRHNANQLPLPKA